jgi:hypothetical protein
MDKIIRNKENKRLTINLKSGTLELLARSTANVSEDDFSSKQLQNLLGSGKIILESHKEDKTEKKWKHKKVKSSEEEIPESGEEMESGSETGETIHPEVPATVDISENISENISEDISEESPESGQPESGAEPDIPERKKTSNIKRKK